MQLIRLSKLMRDISELKLELKLLVSARKKASEENHGLN